MSIEDLNQLKEALLAIKQESVKKPGQPVDSLVKEVHTLYYWSKEDMSKLIEVGIKEEELESLLPLSRALRAAESIWLAKKNEQEDVRKLWLLESNQAKELRSILLHSFHYAYKVNPVMSSKLKHIGKGNSNADLIQDLSDLSELGREFSEELVEIGFDLTLLDKASETADRIGNLLGESEANNVYHEALDLRNRAYTKLMEVVKKVRGAGQYVFWRNHDRVDGYVSEYQRIHKSAKKDQSPELNENINAV